jgi:hypothetical protein
MSRALIINCNYSKLPQYQLFGCINDGINIINRLKKIDPLIQITHMRDDLDFNDPLFPDKLNIIRELNTLITCSERKLYFYYSGHGTSIYDINNDEIDILKTKFGAHIAKLNGSGKDSCMVCYSDKKLELLIDDDFFNILKNLQSNKTLFAFADSCNSGTLFDLCYINVGNYTTSFNNSNDVKSLLKQVNKCTITSSNYPSRINKIKGNIILISGTRDSKYSYEVTLDNQPCGLFTYHLCKLIDHGINNISLKTLYLLLIASINNNQQIPVLTTSMNLNLTKFLVNVFNYSNKPINTNKPINSKVQPKITSKNLNKNTKVNNRISNSPDFGYNLPRNRRR